MSLWLHLSVQTGLLLSSFEESFIALRPFPCEVHRLICRPCIQKPRYMIYMLTYIVAAQPPAQKHTHKWRCQCPRCRTAAQKNRHATFLVSSVTGRQYSSAALNKLGEKKSPQGRSLSWHGVPFVPPYRAVMQNAANPTALLSRRTRELVNRFFAFGWSLKGHLSALVKCQPVH